MIRPAGALALLVAGLASLPAAAHQGPQVRNYVKEGDLAPAEPVGCVSLDEVPAGSNPVDLFLASRSCLEMREGERARDLLLLGGVRGRFDTFRVTDRTAWQAVIVAQQAVLADLGAEEGALIEELLAELNEPSVRGEICGRMLGLRAPDYFPGYMVNHGMGAFAGRTGPEALDPAFDPQEAWPRAVEAYMSCAEARREAAGDEPE